MRFVRIAASLAGLALLSAQAQMAPALTAEPARLSDAALHADYKTYEAMQAGIKALNERGLGLGPKVSDYHLAKAQCWLDVSFHEYTRNDRSDFPQQALEQSHRLVTLMQAGTRPLPDDTPLVNGADRLRPDLWAAAAALKRHEGFRCAAASVACAEVELVHAGNEHRQLGWRHAKPYVQMAEDHLADADAAARQCIPPPAPALPAPPPPPPPPAPVAEAVSYSAALLFGFGAADAGSILPMTRERFDQLVERTRRSGFKLEKITVTGFTDRLNGSGRDDFNQRLSLKRAQTVADLLVAAGIERSIIVVQGKADANPLELCKQDFNAPEKLKDCLAPNRRVEVEVQGQRLR